MTHHSTLAKIARDEQLESQLGSIGVTLTRSQIRAIFGKGYGRALGRLVKESKVHRIGNRYFPAGWLPRPVK